MDIPLPGAEAEVGSSRLGNGMSGPSGCVGVARLGASWVWHSLVLGMAKDSAVRLDVVVLSPSSVVGDMW